MIRTYVYDGITITMERAGEVIQNYRWEFRFTFGGTDHSFQSLADAMKAIDSLVASTVRFIDIGTVTVRSSRTGTFAGGYVYDYDFVWQGTTYTTHSLADAIRLLKLLHIDAKIQWPYGDYPSP